MSLKRRQASVIQLSRWFRQFGRPLKVPKSVTARVLRPGPRWVAELRLNKDIVLKTSRGSRIRDGVESTYTHARTHWPVNALSSGGALGCSVKRVLHIAHSVQRHSVTGQIDSAGRSTNSDKTRHCRLHSHTRRTSSHHCSRPRLCPVVFASFSCSSSRNLYAVDPRFNPSHFSRRPAVPPPWGRHLASRSLRRYADSSSHFAPFAIPSLPLAHGQESIYTPGKRGRCHELPTDSCP